MAANSHFVVIPGSRGSLSYVVKPTGDGESHAWSLAHGAGRKWARSEACRRMRERFRVAELAQTGLGGRVTCEERNPLYEEAPAAYKNIETVIADLVDAGLASIIATPVLLLSSVNAKQLAPSALQAEPNRCESSHRCQFEIRIPKPEIRKKSEARNQKSER